MMYISLILFIGLVIIGFHAVTRKGMLLSGFGSDNRELEEMEAIKDELKEDLLTLQQNFYFEVSDLIEGGNDTTNLVNFYIAAFERRVEMHTDNLTNWHCSKCKKKTRLQKFKQWISKPFSECTTCMSSVWTIIILSAFFLAPNLLIIFMPFAVAGIIQLFEGIKSLSKQQ